VVYLKTLVLGGDQMFSPFFVGGLLTGYSDEDGRINHWLWRRSFSRHRDPVGENGGGLIYQER